MAKTVDKILGKFSQVVKELEDHAEERMRASNWFVSLKRPFYVVFDYLHNKTQETWNESKRAKEEAIRLRKILLGE